MCFLKDVHGASTERTTPNWAVLRECGQEPLQFDWFCTAAKSFNSLLCGANQTQSKIVHADIALCFLQEVLDCGVHTGM